MSFHDIYHEKQVRELCALHALNNLFQSKDAFTKPELDVICHSLSPDNWINPHRSVLGLGNYDINVIMKALQSRGCETIWFDKRKDPSCLNFKNICGYILNVPSEYKISFITLPLRRRHWITIRQLNGLFYNLDSKLDTPQVIGRESDLLNYLKEELDCRDKELFLVVTNEVGKEQSWLKDQATYSNNIPEREAEILQLKDITSDNVNGLTMDEAEARLGTQQIPEAPESLFSTVDIILISLLLGGVAWWFLNKQKKKDVATTGRSYSIQPTSMSLQTSSDNSFIKKLKTSGRSLVVFYGSQTGTGEEFAGRLAKEGVRYRMKGMVADPEECDMEELVNLKSIPNSLAVFCLATYGEGDPTDNAMEFYEWLQNGDADLSGLNYAVFGLGNKTYEHYNQVAIYVDKRLEELGATRVFDLGLGDDDANIEDDFITWKDKFWPAVCEHFGIESTGEDVSMRQYRLQEFTDEETPEKLYTGEMARLHSLKNQRPPFDAKNPFLSKIKVNRELHKGNERSCMHIEFDIEGSKMRYDAGDHLAVYPINDLELVEKIGKCTNTNLDTIFTLINTDEESSKKHPFPCPTTYRTALTHYLDVTSNPRTHVLKELSEYCSDPAEKEKLKSMSSTSPEGKALYQQWIISDNRNIVHILEDTPSCKPALDHLCELLPRLQPRYYSISSSPKLYPNTVHITAVVVEYDTPTGRHNKGVATTWLAAKRPQEDQDPPTAPIFIRKSQFRLPTKTQTPIIMVGPGTGLAPFRGFIQERNQAREEGKVVGETVLYFGCRKKAEDFIYEEELTEYEKNGALTLHLAFSRDQPHKIYVSHLLEQNPDEIWRIVGENNGHLYICGDAKSMAPDVRNIVMKIVQDKGQMTEQQASAYLKKMETQKRYSADVWS